MTIEQYKQAIKDATTKKELDDICYKACLQDTSGLVDVNFGYHVRPKTLYERICRLVHKREHELGLLEDDAYVETDDNGNYVNKTELKQRETEFYASLRKIFSQVDV